MIYFFFLPDTANFIYMYEIISYIYLTLLWFGCSQQQKRHVAAPPLAGVRRRMERNRQKTGRSV